VNRKSKLPIPEPIAQLTTTGWRGNKSCHRKRGCTSIRSIAGRLMKGLHAWLEAQLAEHKTEPNSGWAKPSLTY
jgi:hypothetical protein